ncbi:hypothetical protein DSO57_1004491 [Entomophthora muscae]|uniref:Uncharacterized protein n=1 Tax=Entomophthora muscae TaxID=34485 RepID=A0ACC2UU47_9FUNG|nr:hypothetical protein DSO57_1004491 [Entomophthora muscae]
MKFTEAPSLLSLGNLRGSSLGATMFELVQVFWLWDLAGASACRSLIPKKRGQAGPWSMGPAARRNVGSGFESHPWARVSRGNELSILTVIPQLCYCTLLSALDNETSLPKPSKSRNLLSNCLRLERL